MVAFIPAAAAAERPTKAVAARADGQRRSQAAGGGGGAGAEPGCGRRGQNDAALGDRGLQGAGEMGSSM